MKRLIVWGIVVVLWLPLTSFAAFTQDLEYGSTGPAVSELQNFLTQLKLYSGPITGNFYTLTKEAVMAFQTMYGIAPVSGYFGPLSRQTANLILNQMAAGNGVGGTGIPLSGSASNVTTPSLNLTATTKSCNEIQLTWTLPTSLSGLAKIEVIRNDDHLKTLEAKYAGFTDGSIISNGSYTYAMNLLDSSENILMSSNEVTARVDSCADVTPNKPSNLYAQLVSATKVHLTWQDNSTNEIGFEMERSVDGGSFKSVGKLQPDLKAVDDTGISAGHTFSYRIRALGGQNTESSYSNTAKASVAAPVTNPTLPTQHKIGVFDSVFTTPEFITYGYPVYWALSAWSYTGEGEFNITKARIQEAAHIAYNGGKSIVNNRPIPPRSFLVIDVETSALTNMPVEDMTQRMKWAKEAEPNVKIGLYAYNGPRKTHCEYTDALANNSKWQECFKELVGNYTPMSPYLDAFVYPAYIGKDGIDNGINFYKQLSKDWHKAFPNIPLVPFVWGAYQNIYTANHTPMPDDVLRRYVKSMTEYFDGVIVWGPLEENIDLIRIMKEPGALVRPAGAMRTWVADYAPK